jgi:hypothetical protein
MLRVKRWLALCHTNNTRPEYVSNLNIRVSEVYPVGSVLWKSTAELTAERLKTQRGAFKNPERSRGVDDPTVSADSGDS